MSYNPEIVLPENHEDKYKVDLVHITDDEKEHRLTLAQYTSWGEAEEHLNELQIALENDEIDAIKDDINRLQEQIDNPLPFTFGDYKQPINHKGEAIPHHVDGGGTVHWFDRVESRTPEQSPYELRYFRAYEMESGDVCYDSYPLMPLAEDDPNLAWPLAGLDMYLEKGDVFKAQQFARDVADTYDQPFPDLIELPSFNPEPEYYFGYGIGPSNSPSLEAVKTWMQGSERQFDTLTVREYGSFDQAAVDERELEQLLDSEGLEVAMNLAENMAVAGGYLDPKRDDLRIFFVDDAPQDPFITNREHELAEPEYTIGAMSANGQSFVDVMKTWGKDDYERLVIPQPDWDAAYDLYEMADDLLQNDDLQGAMQVIESAGVDAGIIDPERDDPRLFTQGPADPFTTIRQNQLNSPELSTEEMPVIQIEDKNINATVKDTSWLEGIESSREDISKPDAVDNPYWRLETVRVNNPDGEQIGHSLQMVIYPNVGQATDQVGAPAIREDEPFQILEIAHFENPDDADKFSKEFRSYLVPGLLDGPELAEEVARLEEHPVDWKVLSGQDLDDYRNMAYVVTHDMNSWKLYNPHDERDTQIKAEGSYSDPINDFPPRTDDSNALEIERTSPDFDH